ncbi:MAG: mucoidy inhibitor MuiA family protein [Planctomycetes bacterium]|nr:mucoidy inhibitor MuiA family protein [Planctomycetota bacterium]
MKFLATFVLVSSLTVTALALQPVTVEMEPINANGAITDVTLYRGRAAITRTTELDLEAGGWSIFFRDLPSSATLDSVQASVHGNAKLIAVDTTAFPIEKDTNELLTEIKKEIEKVEEKIALAQADEQSIKMQATFLETLVLRSSSEKEQAVDLAAFQEQLDYIGKQMGTIENRKLANKKLREALTNKRTTLVKRRNSISNESHVQRDAVIDIVVFSQGTVSIEMTYLVSNASWEPSYSIRASEGGESITIDYDANVAQYSGEDWKDVNLTLSTAQPQRSASPPKPSPLFVDIQQPSPPPPTSAMRRTRGAASYVSADYATVENESLGVELGKAASAASVVGNGPAVSFALPRTVSVPSDKNDMQKTAIASIDTTASLFRVAVPMITDSVFIRSEVTNESPFILLPGEASIFHGSDFVGRTVLTTVAPRETFALDLGIDPNVTATRTLLEKKTSSTGLFGSSKETLYDYRVTISNGHDASLEIHLWDRIPVSQNEDIAVDFKNESTPLSTDATYLSADFPRGLLRWDLTVPANSTGDASYTLTWQVDIGRGKDVKMTPLPE